MANQIVHGKPLNNDTFNPFQSSGGIVRSCNDYYSLVQKAGANNLEKDNMGVGYATAFGGKAKKSKKIKKSSSSSKAKKSKKAKKPKKTKKTKKSIVNKAMNGVKKIKNMIMGKVSSMKKKRSKKQKGGQESSGATPMDMRFFDTKASLISASADSGMGVNSAYGTIEPRDVGSGLLAPYNASTSKTANHPSMQQTGGKKSKGKAKKTKVKKTKKEKSMMNKIMKKMSNIKKSILPSDKKKKSKKSKKQRGGDNHEPLGYDLKDKYALYENSKQTGGKDIMKKMSPEPIIKSQQLTTGMIDGAIGVLDVIVKGYNKSLKEASNVKIGNQRLIQGGKKSSPKKLKKTKKPKKKVVAKKPKKKTVAKKPKKKVVAKKPKKKALRRKHKGGNGSDFALTLASRGPANAPDKFWGVDGEKWFRQFNKTGQYIPNSRLAEAATPLLLSGPNNNIVMGYDDMGIGSPYGKA
jgi:hypothetical protein